ncbi:MAG: hypothetical protein ACOYLM_04480 [Methylococcaceae bacterium]|jgi:hypothetical protein
MLQHPFKIVLLALPLLGGAEAKAGSCLNIQAPEGPYGIQLQGSLVGGKPYAAVGSASIHQATFTLNLTASEGGSIIKRTILGSVSVVDCELTLTGSGVDLGFVLKGQITERGKEIFVTAIQSAQPIVASGTLRPRLLRRCSNNTLKGTFTSIAQGFDRVGTGTNIQWLPIGKIGDEQFNGQGCSAYKESIKQGANFSEAEGLLTYKVLEDCTFEMLDQGKPAFFGVIVNGGQVMPYLKLVDGAVRLGEYTRINSSSTPLKCP